ncbi:MAG: AAA family ATPase [Candidatus Obscuribacterales bacterium]|nr:AAA family ATPase [Candidatus Obscuribacterales bacterium]
MRSKNTNYVIWMLSVAFIALIVGQYFITPGEVVRPANKPVAQSVGRGRSAPPATKTQPEPKAQPDTKVQPELKALPETKTQPVVVAAPAQPTSYSELVKLIQDKPSAISKVKFLNGKNTVEVTTATAADKPVKITIPGPASESLIASLTKAGIAVEAQEAPAASSSGTSGLMAFLMTFGPVLLLVGVMVFLARRNSGAGGAGGIASSRAKDKDEIRDKITPVTFDDVKGCDEAVLELRRIIHGLVDPEVNDHFDGERPKGVILVGPPGTGKTLLAKATATECEGSMDILSGSDFVELFVGVGAARVRDTVNRGNAKYKKTGKKHIIFIDEIDAIGGKRGNGASANRNDEREQTLNAILVAMDGAESNEGIIWMAATNRVDMLDEALLRPGRFDSQVTVDLPNREGRVQLFTLYTEKKPVAADITPDKLAVRTYGYSGAQIKMVCSRAALLAGERWSKANEAKLKEYRAKHPLGQADDEPDSYTYGLAMGGFHRTVYNDPKKRTKRALPFLKDDPTAVVTLTDFDEAIDFVLLGDANRSRQTAMMRAEKENTAWHEAGHAVAAAAMRKLADPVTKITIMARSRALGYVQQMPDNDRVSINIHQLVSRMIMAMAGRAAQEVYLNECDTGAQNDFQQVTDIAYRMVTEWGMSRLGSMNVGSRTSISRGAAVGSAPRIGEDLVNQIDDEWRRIITECEKIAMLIVTKEKPRMEATVKVLMEKETILRDEWEAMLAEIPSNITPEEVKFDPRSKPAKEAN